MIDTIVDIRPVLRAFDKLKRVDGRKVFRDAKKPLRADLRDHAKHQASPDGIWKPLASSTLARRARGSKRRRTGRILGRLPTALLVTYGENFLRAESRAKFSRIHQDGAMAGHGANIPARPFMWISRRLKRAVRDLYTAALDRAWAGR